jgi:hypothetical protein
MTANTREVLVEDPEGTEAPETGRPPRAGRRLDDRADGQESSPVETAPGPGRDNRVDAAAERAQPPQRAAVPGEGRARPAGEVTR